MDKVKYRVTLDLERPGVQHTIYAKRGDALTREVYITLRAGVNSYAITPETTAVLYATADEATIFSECDITANTISTELTTNVMNADNILLEFRLTDTTGAVLTTPQIKVVAEDTLYDEEAITAKDDFSALLNAITRAENARIVDITAEGNVLTITYADGQTVSVELDINVEGGDGVSFEPGNALELTEDGVLNVKTTDVVSKTSSLPLTSKGAAALEEAIRKDFPDMPDVPVQSVNGKTGEVKLSAADVGARPSNWMPSASDVGALPANTSIPKNTSDLTNDSGFITKLVSDLANYYSKSQTLNKTEINALISAIPKFAISVVTSLPTSNISSTTVYLVKSGTGSDLYTEYIYVNGAWEPLGSQKVDLTGYATETWVNGKLADYLTESQLQTAINTALAQAKASGEFNGADGVSPTISVTTITGGHRITITDKNGKKNVDVMDGTDGKNGSNGRGITSVTRTSGNGSAGTTDTYTIKYTDNTTSTFTVYNGEDGENGNDGRGIESVVQTTTSSADGGTNVVTITYSDGTKSTFSFKNGSKGSKGDTGANGNRIRTYPQKVTTKNPDGYYELPLGNISGGTANPDDLIILQILQNSDDVFVSKVVYVDAGYAYCESLYSITGAAGKDGDDGSDGERGFSILRVTTAPSAYTTETGGFTPAYRIALSTVKSQASVEEVRVGDTILRNYYTYKVGYVDASYAYLTTYASIRGSAGPAYTLTDTDKTSIANSVKSSLPTITMVGKDADGVSHTWTIYGS